jgi:hypothetical protein
MATAVPVVPSSLPIFSDEAARCVYINDTLIDPDTANPEDDEHDHAELSQRTLIMNKEVLEIPDSCSEPDGQGTPNVAFEELLQSSEELIKSCGDDKSDEAGRVIVESVGEDATKKCVACKQTMEDVCLQIQNSTSRVLGASSIYSMHWLHFLHRSCVKHVSVDVYHARTTY